MAKKRKSSNRNKKSNPAPVEVSAPAPQSAPVGSSKLLNVGRVALVFAVGIAVYLLVIALTQGQAAGCEEGKSCNAVLASKWAKLLGVPIGALGLITYVAMLGLSFFRAQNAARIFVAVTIIGGALWFTGVQAFILKTFCPWCCTAHAFATLGTVLVLLGLSKSKTSSITSGPNLLATAAAVGALVLTAIVQFKSPEPKQVTIAARTETPAVKVVKEKRATVDVHDKFKISTVELPALGDAQTATNVAVGLFDFSCSHCRKLMKVIKPVVDEFGDELAIVKLPGFYNENGREIQKLMLPVFREAPEVYEALGDELYKETVKAELATVRAELERRLGSQRFQDILSAYGPWAAERVAESKAVLEANRGDYQIGQASPVDRREDD